MATFVKGANKLFWLDLENSSKRFMYIWMVRQLLLHLELIAYYLIDAIV